MRRERKQASASGRRLGTRGESMVVAVVLMLVFFILGLAVLTGSSVASSSVNSRVRYRQAYYYARSTLDILDENLRNGMLGDQIRDDELARILALQGEDRLELTDVTKSIALTFGEANAPEDLSYVDGGALLCYDVVSQRIRENLVNVTMDNVLLSFRVGYAGQSYGVLVTYAYSGFAERINGIWVWTGTWRLRSMA